MTPNVPCMGGWCTRRDHCANYVVKNRRNPVERLCPPGRDGAGPQSLQPDQPKPAEVGELTPA